MKADLPIGTVVLVTEHRHGRKDRIYRAIVRGYDMWGSKYNLSPTYMKNKFHPDPLCWAFVGEVQPWREGY